MPVLPTETEFSPNSLGPRPLTRRHGFFAGAILLLALAVRLLALFSSDDRSWPHSLRYEGDAVTWAKTVELLDRGEKPDDGIPTRFYAIAYFLHGLHSGGPITNFLPYKILFCFLSALVCAVVYLGFARSFSDRVATIGAGLCVFSFGSTLIATSVNVEGLYTPLLTLILVGSVELLWRPRIWLALGLALLHGLALLLRGEHLLVLGLLLLQYLWSTRRAQGGPTATPTLQKRLLLAGTMGLGAFLVCLPYAMQNTQATTAYNTVQKKTIDFNATGVQWLPEAIAYVESLPAFLRGKTVAYVSGVGRDQAKDAITAEFARTTFLEAFGGTPEPLRTPVFIASTGPLNFALANHPEALGEFSKVALRTRFSDNPKLNLTTAEHLQLYNHGYAVGWGYIRSRPGVWLSNLGRKLVHAYEGVSLGFTAYNLPYGREGVRRAVDLQTPFPGAGIVFRLAFGVLLLLGSMILWESGSRGAPWLVVAGSRIIIILMFFGFARQAVSIYPVYYLMVALGVDYLLARLLTLKSLSPHRGRLLTTVVCVVLCLLELAAARSANQFTAEGRLQPLDRFGERSFTAHVTINIRKQDGTQ